MTTNDWKEETKSRPFVEIRSGKYAIRFWRTTGGWISEVIDDGFMEVIYQVYGRE